MNTLILVLCMLLTPILIGNGIICILYRKSEKGQFFIGDALVTGWIAIIGTAEAAHLCGVFLDFPFSRCVMLFGGLTAFLMLLALAVSVPKKARERGCLVQWTDWRPAWRYVPLCALVLSQMVYINYLFQEGSIYRQGDMTVETVESFLYTDGFYQVNPMTGAPYTAGIPLRLEILCLPTLYGSLSKIFSVQPQTVVWLVMPWIVLLGCYLAFGCVGRILFPGESGYQVGFLTVAALLLWAGGYALGMDGFGLLYGGWRGVTIRSAMLIPYLISVCLRRKWKLAVLCVAAEACIVWTLYGAGVCVLLAAGLALCGLIVGRADRSGGEEAAG